MLLSMGLQRVGHDWVTELTEVFQWSKIVSETLACVLKIIEWIFRIWRREGKKMEGKESEQKKGYGYLILKIPTEWQGEIETS